MTVVAAGSQKVVCPLLMHYFWSAIVDMTGIRSDNDRSESRSESHSEFGSSSEPGHRSEPGFDSEFVLRRAGAADQPGIIRLIDSVYREYGDRVCLEGAESDLLDLAGIYDANGGGFWVLESDDVGSSVRTRRFLRTARCWTNCRGRFAIFAVCTSRVVCAVPSGEPG